VDAQPRRPGADITASVSDELDRMGIKPASVLGYTPQTDDAKGKDAIVIAPYVTKPLMLPDNKISRCAGCHKKLQHRPHLPKGATFMCSPCALKKVKRQKPKGWVETRMPVSACPLCGYQTDAASGLGAPVPGDLTVCLQCASPLRFTDTLQLRAVSPDEFTNLDLQLKNGLRRVMAAVRTLDRRKVKGDA
jgi:hypothetical protein